MSGGAAAAIQSVAANRTADDMPNMKSPTRVPAAGSATEAGQVSAA